jgi:hypothetical protein
MSEATAERIGNTWPCRWCGHTDWQHNIPPALVVNAVGYAPCDVEGCPCEDYEEED